MDQNPNANRPKRGWSGESLRAALHNLRRNPLRTILSTLGVVIGVASLVAILALGDGLERYGRSQISSTTDLQSIQVIPRTTEIIDHVRVRVEDPAILGDADIESIHRQFGERAEIVPILVASARAGAPDAAETTGVLLTATGPEAAALLPDGLLAGRYISGDDIDRNSRVVVVPETIRDWFGATAEQLPGRALEIDGEEWTIIGVFELENDQGPIRFQIPFSAANRKKLEGLDRPVELLVHARDVTDVEPLSDEIEEWLSKRFGGKEKFHVVSNRARAAQARQGFLVFKLVMGAIVGISLLVGGIGIMNILLASVAERTREIGVRKATGATRRDILHQFLAESIAISGIGSVLGVILGLTGAFVITAGIRHYSEAQVYAAFSWSSVIAATAAALLVGLVFGTYPARRAARLSPIDAIRHD